MSRVIDAVIAYRVLKLLVTPFNKTKAFEFGIIDDKGKVLKKSKEIKNPKERNAYTLLIRFEDLLGQQPQLHLRSLKNNMVKT